MIDGFAELTLQAHDRRALERFYTDVIGLDVLSREDDRTWLQVGERARLGIWSPGPKEFGDRGGAHVHFAFTVTPDGLDRLCERLREHGIDAEGREHDGGDRSVYFTDPEGNVVEAWDHFGRGRDAEDLAA